MKYSLQILKKKFFLKRRKHPSPNALNIKYFWTLGDFRLLLNYPILNFKKTVCPKNLWMRHCPYVNILNFASFLHKLTNYS